MDKNKFNLLIRGLEQSDEILDESILKNVETQKKKEFITEPEKLFGLDIDDLEEEGEKKKEKKRPVPEEKKEKVFRKPNSFETETEKSVDDNPVKILLRKDKKNEVLKLSLEFEVEMYNLELIKVLIDSFGDDEVEKNIWEEKSDVLIEEFKKQFFEFIKRNIKH